MITDTLKKYIHKFSALHVDRSKGALAPHKPILLLAIISEIERGNINENKIYITPELVAQFTEMIRQNKQPRVDFYSLDLKGCTALAGPSRENYPAILVFSSGKRLVYVLNLYLNLSYEFLRFI